MICPECKSENVEGARFCSFCASPIPQLRTCPSCQGQNPVGAKFCNLCARRLEDEAPLSQVKAPATARSAEQDPAEDDKGATSSTAFCHNCHEPVGSDQLMFDIDGNRLCKSCMLSGGKKKDPRARAIERLSQELDGTTATRIPKKVARNRLDPLPPEPSGGGGIFIAVVVLLLLAGGAAAGYHFKVHEKLGLFGGPSSGSSGMTPSPKPPSPDPAKKDPDKPDDGGETTPPPPVPGAPIDFIGVFQGLQPGTGQLGGAMIFEAPTGEIVYVIPKGAESLAKTYQVGVTYKMRFKPGDRFRETRRILWSQLEGIPQEAD